MQLKWVSLLAIFALSLGVYLAITIAPPGTKPPNLANQTKHMSWYPAPRQLATFELNTHRNETMRNSDLLGYWTLVFVGYTFCPDICPVTLAELNKVYPELEQFEKSSPLKVWFLSVDPKRDTSERLNEYISYFNPEFVASTGGHDQLFPLVRSMGMTYSMTESTDKPNYLVDHSGSVAVINPQGQIVGRFKPKAELGELAISDVEQILADLPVLLKNG